MWVSMAYSLKQTLRNRKPRAILYFYFEKQNGSLSFASITTGLRTTGAS